VCIRKENNRGLHIKNGNLSYAVGHFCSFVALMTFNFCVISIPSTLVDDSAVRA
jgi:hypothetical protein